jgi:uncharacterized membrane protein
MTMTLPDWFGPFQARPRLVAAFVAGAALGFACHLLGLHWTGAAILGWDGVCAGYIGIMLLYFVRQSPDAIRAKAAEEDEGRVTILTVVLMAAAAAIVAIVMELPIAHRAHGIERGVRVALAFLTVALSWFMSHLVFAVHYAHGYYARELELGVDAKGLRFPGEEEPDYWDFLHFAVIVGVAAQTADIAISCKRLRRLNTVHALFSFVFNTVVVALTINLLASLFG